MIKFPYMQYGPNPRPVIPVVISNKGKKVAMVFWGNVVFSIIF